MQTQFTPQHFSHPFPAQDIQFISDCHYYNRLPLPTLLLLIFHGMLLQVRQVFSPTTKLLPQMRIQIRIEIRHEIQVWEIQVMQLVLVTKCIVFNCNLISWHTKFIPWPVRCFFLTTHIRWAFTENKKRVQLESLFYGGVPQLRMRPYLLVPLKGWFHKMISFLLHCPMLHCQEFV